MVTVRLVHLWDKHKRKELMIVYGEDVTLTGFIAAELLPGGKGSEQWTAIGKDSSKGRKETYVPKGIRAMRSALARRLVEVLEG